MKGDTSTRTADVTFTARTETRYVYTENRSGKHGHENHQSHPSKNRLSIHSVSPLWSVPRIVKSILYPTFDARARLWIHINPQVASVSYVRKPCLVRYNG